MAAEQAVRRPTRPAVQTATTPRTHRKLGMGPRKTRRLAEAGYAAVLSPVQPAVRLAGPYPESGEKNEGKTYSVTHPRLRSEKPHAGSFPLPVSTRHFFRVALLTPQSSLGIRLPKGRPVKKLEKHHLRESGSIKENRKDKSDVDRSWKPL